jgi:hypothetical protein
MFFSDWDVEGGLIDEVKSSDSENSLYNIYVRLQNRHSSFQCPLPHPHPCLWFAELVRRGNSELQAIFLLDFDSCTTRIPLYGSRDPLDSDHPAAQARHRQPFEAALFYFESSPFSQSQDFKAQRMATHVPEKLKAADLTRFIVRATQLEHIKPVIAYWCK